jgi:hypothetical protein
MKTQIKLNVLKWGKFVVSHSFRNHLLWFTMLLGTVLDRFVNAIRYKEKFIIRACLPKGSFALLCFISDIVWDFWSGRICDRNRSCKVANGPEKLSKTWKQ